ncbi:hypothetical protein VTI74DRAFT_9867 [Chaetomium olivicolor]
MDLRDDPSTTTTTTTTTDYDSGDSEGIDYVYEGQRLVERRSAKGKSPRRKRSPRAKPRGPGRCTCGGTGEEEDAENTVFEEDTDTEEESHHCRPTRPRPCGPSGASDERGHHRGDRKRLTKKPPRERTPYIEEYPDDTPRPVIILKEHRIPRRFSASDAKRVRDSEERSLSSGSRGRSPSGKRLPPRPPCRSSKEAPKPSSQRRRRLDCHGTAEDAHSHSDPESPQPESEETGLPITRRTWPEPDPEVSATIARSSAWNEHPQPRCSSSWPLHSGSELPERRPRRREHDYNTDEEEEEHPFSNHIRHDEHHREHHHLRQGRAPSFRHRERPRIPSLPREPQHRQTPPPQRQREQEREESHHPRRYPRTVVSRASMATLDHGRRSVATSLCEVWQGRPEDWESPYPSGSDADWDSDIEEPISLLRMEDLPPRRSSPHLLPPHGDRSDFGFQVSTRCPTRSPQYPPLYTTEPSPAPLPGTRRRQTWANPASNVLHHLLLMENGLFAAVIAEPDAMTDEDDANMCPPSRASRRRSRPAESVVMAASSRGWTSPLTLPRSRAVSPVFSARKTRELLSPKPTRAATARFDFGAWGVDPASRSSLALGVL